MGRSLTLDPTPVWIDTDIALGAGRGDVDDAFAIAALLASPQIRIVGLSTVFGNTTSARAETCARALLVVAGRQLEVVAGAERAGQRTHAAEAMAGLASGTRLLALGPLTNVAAALAIDPGLADRVELSVVGGNPTSLGRWPPLWPFEFNLSKDPAAARAVFAAQQKLRLFPLDACRRLRIGPAGLRRLRSASPLGRYLVRGSLRWLAYAPLRYRSWRFPLWDVVPALDAAGRLDASSKSWRLSLTGRGLLVSDDAAPVREVIRRFDARRARAELDGLLGC